MVIRPPHGDATLAVDGAAHDLERAVFARVTSREVLEARAAVAFGQSNPRRGVLLLAAAELITSPALHGRLRAAGAALANFDDADSPVRLRLDDLELANGTTERTADIAAAIARPLPWQLEHDELVREVTHGTVRLVVERDQELPAACALAAALDPACTLELAGEFARRHAHAIAQLPALARARTVDEPVRWRIEFAGCDPLAWHHAIPDAPGAWAGMLPIAALLDVDRLIASECRAVVVAFCAIDDATIVSGDGTRIDRRQAIRSAARLADAGVTVSAEWLVGAPGVNEAQLDATSQRLDDDPPFVWLAGVRAFGWPVDRLSTQFGDVAVELSSPAADRDLARTRPFHAANSIAAERRDAVLAELGQRLVAARRLSPGHVAAALISPPAAVRPRGTNVMLDDDCALVQSPVTLDGKPGPAWYAINFRTGSLLALDVRLAPRLASLRTSRPPAEVLDNVPAAQRERLLKSLVERRILAEVS